ncbi:MAG: transposase [Lachnospiraceae bacterium]|nr:transposase [Lachnospiraceae bacterium]
MGKCMGNGPMGSFWGILKRGPYYGRKPTGREQLVPMVRGHIAYYNSSRPQRRLGVHTPMEAYAQYRAA